jgi:hypothetical protein
MMLLYCKIINASFMHGKQAVMHDKLPSEIVKPLLYLLLLLISMT